MKKNFFLSFLSFLLNIFQEQSKEKALQHMHMYDSMRLIVSWKSLFIEIYHEEYSVHASDIKRMDIECIIVSSAMGLQMLDIDTNWQWTQNCRTVDLRSRQSEMQLQGILSGGH